MPFEAKSKLRAAQALRLDGAPVAVGHAQLEHGLGQIDADDHAGARLNENGKARSIHVGLPFASRADTRTTRRRLVL
jgi:hypothetical protein